MRELGATELEGAEDEVSRGRCLGCFRPRRDCYCAAIPRIDNRTEVLIVQHRRERFHPFNTARMVHRALRNSSLLVDHTPGLAARLVAPSTIGSRALGPDARAADSLGADSLRPGTLRPGAGLLYPGPGAELLDELPAERRPAQLVVIDGTWHHAKTLVRDIAALGDLPRYRIAPSEPSRYRIRREPSALLLSTVEATVAALRALEPQTRGWDELLAAFHGMVESQLAHPKSADGWRSNAARTRGGRNIPAALLGDLDQIVVAYGESVPGDEGRQEAARVPVYWTAERLGTGERFTCAIQPPSFQVSGPQGYRAQGSGPQISGPQVSGPLSPALLAHFELTADTFARALPLAEAQAAWRAFERPSDVLAVYNFSTARLLRQIASPATPCLILKSVDFNPERRYSTLDEVVAGEGLAVEAAPHLGRAGKRLASMAALIGHLRGLRRYGA